MGKIVVCPVDVDALEGLSNIGNDVATMIRLMLMPRWEWRRPREPSCRYIKSAVYRIVVLHS